MCHDVLSQVDVKAICKHRGLSSQAASSRSLLESLFVSDAGVVAVFETLDPPEIALLHLLKTIDTPVDISFFGCIYGVKSDKWSYGTFTQRHQSVFSKVKERLVRRGILLTALGPETWSETTKLERMQFALPRQFAPYLPPLIESPKQLAGDGEWRSEVARNKLKTAIRRGGGKPDDDETKANRAEIVDGTLRFGDHPFRADRLVQWQKKCWEQKVAQPKERSRDDRYALHPTDVVVQVLGDLQVGQWCDADGLAGSLKALSAFQVDSSSVCESGWRWGCLARQKAQGKTWYRLAPQSPVDDVPPQDYLEITSDGQAIVNLDVVPFELLEGLVAISDQQPVSRRGHCLLLAPNLIKLGRAAESVMTLPAVDWLQQNSSAFREAIQTLRRRRGKTIIHENLSVARVSDLALKVALEKTLGDHLVSLSDEYIAFPRQRFADVKRVVTKSGHVIKDAKVS